MLKWCDDIDVQKKIRAQNPVFFEKTGFYTPKHYLKDYNLNSG